MTETSKCNVCGAIMKLDVAQNAFACQYCGNLVLLKREEQPQIQQPKEEVAPTPELSWKVLATYKANFQNPEKSSLHYQVTITFYKERLVIRNSNANVLTKGFGDAKTIFYTDIASISSTKATFFKSFSTLDIYPKSGECFKLSSNQMRDIVEMFRNMKCNMDENISITTPAQGAFKFVIIIIIIYALFQIMPLFFL